jgi:hypothetical protein
MGRQRSDLLGEVHFLSFHLHRDSIEFLNPIDVVISTDVPKIDAGALSPAVFAVVSFVVPEGRFLPDAL